MVVVMSTKESTHLNFGVGVPGIERKTNKSVTEEIEPDCSWEALMMREKLKYFGHIMKRYESLEKDHMMGKTEYKRR